MNTNSLHFTKDQTEIGDNTLKEIDSVTFEEPSLITIIPENAFYQVNFKDDNFVFPSSLLTVEYGSFMKSNICKLVLGKNVESIGIHSFSYNTKLKDVDLSNTKIKVLDQCFRGCVSIEKLELPNEIEYIVSKAFESCKSLTDVILPQSLKKIGASAFQNCSKIEQIIIPMNVKEISTYSFSGCHNLKEVYFRDITELKLYTSSFETLNTTFYVPDNSNSTDIDNISKILETENLVKYSINNTTNNTTNNTIISLEDIKLELYNICDDICCLKEVEENLILWNNNGINLENGITEVSEQYLEWCARFELFINQIKEILIDLINIDDNIKSDYTKCREDLNSLDTHLKKEKVDMLCLVYNTVINNLNQDIKLLSEAYQTLGNYADIGINLGDGLESIRNQIDKIDFNISESNKKISGIYYDCEIFAKILLKFN